MEVASKLQIKQGMSVAFVDPPEDLATAIAGQAPHAATDAADVVIVFVRNADQLDAAAEQVVEATRREALTWVGYPKAGQLGTDLNRDVVRETLGLRGARTVRQVALDDVWSALRLRAD